MYLTIHISPEMTALINRYIRFRLRARSRSTRASCCPDSARTHAYTHARVAATCRSAAHCAAADFGGTPRPRRERAVRRLPHAGRERQVLQRVVLHGASDISQPVESRPRHAACPPDGKMRSGRTTVMRIVRPTRRLSRASPRSSTRPGRSSGTATEGVEDHGARGKGLQMLSQRGDILHVADMVHQENSPSVENAPRAPIAAPEEARSRGEIVAREGVRRVRVRNLLGLGAYI